VCNRIQINGHSQGLAPQSRGGERSLTAGMAGSDYNYVVFFSQRKLPFPIRNRSPPDVEDAEKNQNLVQDSQDSKNNRILKPTASLG